MTAWILLKFLHVAAGVLWMGGAVAAIFFWFPAVRASGAAGEVVMKGYLQQFAAPGPFQRLAQYAPLLCVLSGLVMYHRTSGGFDPGFMLSPFGSVFTAGCLSGIAAYLWGSLVQARRAKRMGGILVTAKGQPSAGQAAAIRALQDQIRRGGYVGITLVFMALAGMVAIHPM